MARSSNLIRMIVLGVCCAPLPAFAGNVEDLAKRLDRLEQENKQLRHDLEALSKSRATEQQPAAAATTVTQQPQPPASQMRQVVRLDTPPPLRPSQSDSPSQSGRGSSGHGVIGYDNDYSYAMLDPTVAGKTKPLTLMEAKRTGQLSANGVIVGGAVTVIADYQHTNRPDEFGYMMRQPGANQIGQAVSEAALHTVQVGVTANITRWLSAYAEILYDPEQSFGGGTLTSLERNQLSLRKGYVLIGDLDRAPVYAVVGKIESPFGQTDTVNPFSLSSDFHTFAGLSYGALVGYSGHGFNLSAEAVQGGAEFRSLNSPVHDTNVPSMLNNYVVDANYTLNLGQPDRTLLVGASYEGGSYYCQGFPVQHFGACDDANPAWAAYTTLRWDAATLRGEYMQTVDVWPGTFNPNPPLDVFAAHRVTSYDIGGKYAFNVFDRQLDASLDYSILLAGPDGSPWHRQDQLVAGLAYFVLPNAKLFTEAVFINGFEPLQFLTGGDPNMPTPTTIIADSDARSQVFLAGANIAF
jgi:hypothetical protein